MKLQLLLCAVLLAIPIVSMAEDNSKDDDFYVTYESSGIHSASRVKLIRVMDDADQDISYTYDPQSGDIIKAVNKDLITNFKYDSQGDLSQISNSEGEEYHLQYTSSKKIEHIVETKKIDQIQKTLIFKYDTGEQPSKIILVGKGEVTFKYDSKGKISAIDSSKYSDVKLEVLSALYDMSNALHSAGVDMLSE